MTIKTYRDLLVWQKSMHLVTSIYGITRQMPKEETYGIIAQIRKSSISIPSNIAEGFGRNTKNDYLRFLQISIGSLYELQTQLQICLNLKYLTKSDFNRMYSQSREIERMLSSMIKKLGKNK